MSKSDYARGTGFLLWMIRDALSHQPEGKVHLSPDLKKQLDRLTAPELILQRDELPEIIVHDDWNKRYLTQKWQVL